MAYPFAHVVTIAITLCQHGQRGERERNGKEHKFQRQLQLRFCVLPVDGSKLALT